MEIEKADMNEQEVEQQVETHITTSPYGLVMSMNVFNIALTVCG